MPQTLAQTIKAKYPQYKDIDDTELEDKILAKYPQYSSYERTNKTKTIEPLTKNRSFFDSAKEQLTPMLEQGFNASRAILGHDPEAIKKMVTDFGSGLLSYGKNIAKGFLKGGDIYDPHPLDMAAPVIGADSKQINDDYKKKNWGALAGDAGIPLAMALGTEGFNKVGKGKVIIPKEISPVAKAIERPNLLGDAVELGNKSKAIEPPKQLGPAPYNPSLPNLDKFQEETGNTYGPTKKKTLTTDKGSQRLFGINGADYLSDNPLYATVPNRLRPEAPNQTLFRNLLPSAITDKIDTPTTTQPKGVSLTSPVSVPVNERALQGLHNPETPVDLAPLNPKEPINLEPPNGGNKPPVKAGPELPPSDFKPKKNALLVDVWRQFIGHDDASKLVRKKTTKDFTYLDNQEGQTGTEKLINFNKKLIGGDYPEVRSFFDGLHTQLKELLPKVGYKEDYLPLMFDEFDPKEVVADRKRLGLKPSFTLESTLHNYEELLGLKNEDGTPKYKPKFENPSDLLGYYAGRVERLKGEHLLFNHLKENNLIKPMNGAPKGWKDLPSDFFPTAGERQVYKAPPELAKLITQTYEPPKMTPWQKTQAVFKQWSLAAGVPFTGINAHGASTVLNPLGRNAIFNPRNYLGGIKDALLPYKALEGMNHNDMINAVRDGNLTLSSEGMGHDFHSIFDAVDTLPKKFINGSMWLTHHVWEKYLFGMTLPAEKLKLYTRLKDNAIKQGLEYKDAARFAGDQSNQIFGGLNKRALMHDVEKWNKAQSYLLAPDWLATNGMITRDMAKSLVDGKTPQGKLYRNAMLKVGAGLVASNIHNYLNGKTPDETKGGFEVPMGKDSKGKNRVWNPAGSALDGLKIPVDIISAIYNKDLTKGFTDITNRASSGVRIASDLTVAAPREMKGKSLKDQGKRIIKPFADNATHPWVREPIQALMGKQSPEETGVSMGELPFYYRKPQSGGSFKVPSLIKPPSRPGR